jgi:hypothetical protein
VKYWQTTLALLTLSASIALGEDFKTVNGREYKNATLSRVEPDGIVVVTKSGISKIYFVELPKEVQKRFGYDTDKIEAEKAAERAAEEKRVEAAQRERAKKGTKIESKIESTVSVEREITDTPFMWSMTLRQRDLSFIYFIGGGFSPRRMSFSNPDDAADVLAKFVEWDQTARQNNAESFKKKINAKCTFQFRQGERGGFSELECDGATFSRDSVDKFNELLKQLPEAKAELASKIAKAQKEEALFK